MKQYLQISFPIHFFVGCVVVVLCVAISALTLNCVRGMSLGEDFLVWWSNYTGK